MIQNFLFPSKFQEDVMYVVNFINMEVGELSTLNMDKLVKYSMDGDTYVFPYRVYNEEIQSSSIKQWNDNKQAIFHCIFSRNSNGFVRQKHIQCLLGMDIPDLSIPYVLKVCDEYIIEILKIVYDYFKLHDSRKIERISIQNKYLMDKSYSRMVSYWNEYYRKQFPNFKNYIGYKLFTECLGFVRE